MKKIILNLMLISGLCVSTIGSAQQINWESIQTKRHFVNVHTGWDYGMVAGLGYGQKLKTKLPVIINIEGSAPFGNKVFDDLKAKLGAQARVLKTGNFHVSVKVQGLFRKYENEFVRLINFGSDMSTNFGYYKKKWYAAGEFGFDKAVTTHIRNSPTIKNMYAEAKDGWYVPTGGNFYYGIASGFSFKGNDIYLKVGKNVTQDLRMTATIPLYFQLGYNFKF